MESRDAWDELIISCVCSPRKMELRVVMFVLMFDFPGQTTGDKTGTSVWTQQQQMETYYTSRQLLSNYIELASNNNISNQIKSIILQFSHFHPNKKYYIAILTFTPK